VKRVALPVAAGALALVGSLAATLFLYLAAARAVDRSLEERLRGAGESAVRLLEGGAATPARLRALMVANQLEAVFVIDDALQVRADDAGGPLRRADLLRLDPQRLQRALAGEATISASYTLGEATVITGYFPLRGEPGAPRAVLALEAGQAFAGARRGLSPALLAGVLLSLVGAAALALLAGRWSLAERARRKAAERAARGEALQQMAAVAAHEIRNPLHIIRATVELMVERAGPALQPRDGEALKDVLEEVERLHRLTNDFLDLAADRPLSLERVDLAALLEEVARGAEASWPEVRVRRELPALLSIEGDPGRLRQVFGNLLSNAAQAQERGEVALWAAAERGQVCVQVRDAGPGVPEELRPRLFDPFVTTKPSGTGLGLAICRRLVERHGGSVALVQNGQRGATFEVRLPVGGA
jgi:signal transduction histidine kinase